MPEKSRFSAVVFSDRLLTAFHRNRNNRTYRDHGRSPVLYQHGKFVCAFFHNAAEADQNRFLPNGTVVARYGWDMASS